METPLGAEVILGLEAAETVIGSWRMTGTTGLRVTSEQREEGTGRRMLGRYRTECGAMNQTLEGGVLSVHLHGHNS